MTTDWNNSSFIDTFYQYDGCPSGTHCVAVYEYNEYDGAAGYAGGILNNGAYWTGHYLDPGGQWGHPYVKLNNQPTLNANQRKHTACQEIGHAFGLNHQYVDASSCMNDTWPAHSEDLNGLYNHITASNPWG